MDRVILEFRRSCDGAEGEGGTAAGPEVLEAWGLSDEDWVVLTEEEAPYGRPLDIVVEKAVLARKATYFCALFRNFREATCDRINVDYSRSVFCSLLRFLYSGHLNISPSNAGDFLVAATFFGVDEVIALVGRWAALTINSQDVTVIEDVLRDLPSIWSASNLLGKCVLSNFCPKFLAINFVASMSLRSFLNLPSSLLSACVSHPQLTVCSELQLYQALLKWCEEHDLDSESEESKKHIASMLSKVRKVLLPPGVRLGTLHENYPPDTSSSTIRFTHHLQSLDLSGCYGVTAKMLFLSSSRASNTEEDNNPFKLQAGQRLSIFGTKQPQASSLYGYRPSEPHRKCSLIPKFERLKRVNLSHCWEISQLSFVLWVGESCPNLLELFVKNCPQMTITLPQSLALMCPFLQLVDLSLDVILVRKDDFVKPGIEEMQSTFLGDSPGLPLHRSPSVLANLTKLSLRGRTEITGSKLLGIAKYTPALLEIDLSMCALLTDAGIASFLRAYPRGLERVKAKSTAFGSLSCRALNLPVINSGSLPDQLIEGNISDSSGTNYHLLAELDLGSCRGASEEDLSLVLRNHSHLTHLSLGETNLTDAALSWFKGRSLQQLDVRDTPISASLLVSIIKSNPELRSLDIRGCKRACVDKYDLLVRENPEERDRSTKDCDTFQIPLVFQELGTRGILEDLRVGWRFSDFALDAILPTLKSLRSLTIGIGATISDVSLQNLSDNVATLEHLSLSFQFISDDGLIRFLDKANRLRVLELRCCAVQLSEKSITAFAARRISSLRVLKLERAVPWMLDKQLRLLCKSCANLSQFSLVGCKGLTEGWCWSFFVFRNLEKQSAVPALDLIIADDSPDKRTQVFCRQIMWTESLKIIAEEWCGLTHLRLEDCKGLTTGGAECVLQSCGALEKLTLRHNGKGLGENFVIDAMFQLPLLWYLSLDMCDAVTDQFKTPDQLGSHPLNIVLIARCKLPAHVFHYERNSQARASERCHRDTIVLQRNGGENQEYTIKERI